MIYFELFILFFKIGMFSIGGGYAALPIIENEIVVNKHYLNTNEFNDIITISQLTPGPISINAATFIGTKIATLQGAICATAGFIAPSVLIVGLITIFYYRYKNLELIKHIFKYLKSASLATISYVAVSMFQSIIFPCGSHIIFSAPYHCLKEFLIFTISIFILHKFNANPMLIICTCAILGILIF